MNKMKRSFRNKSKSPYLKNKSKSPYLKNKSKSPYLKNKSKSPYFRNKSRSRYKSKFRYKSKSPYFRNASKRFSTNQQSSKYLSPIQPGEQMDYKNTSLIAQFISEQAKILSRRRSRLTFKQQRLISRAIKQARILSLLPFTSLYSIK